MMNKIVWIVFLCLGLVFSLHAQTQENQKEILTDDELLTKVQSQTFRYFWDFAHPVSGLARERTDTLHIGHEVVTIGGSGDCCRGGTGIYHPGTRGGTLTENGEVSQ